MKTRTVACEVLAAVMKSPRTVVDVEEMIGSNRKTARDWIDAFRASGVFYVKSWARSQRGQPTATVAFQAVPFENADAPKPAPIRHRQK